VEESLFEEILIDNSPNLEREINIQNHELKRTSSRLNKNIFTDSHSSQILKSKTKKYESNKRKSRVR
jgi:hypothetical protein